MKQTKMPTLLELYFLLGAPDSKQIIETLGVSDGNKGYIRRGAEGVWRCCSLRQVGKAGF